MPVAREFKVAMGVRIAALREGRFWSQDDVAKQMQLRGHRTYVQQRQQEVEAGVKPLNLQELISMSRVFGVPISFLLGVPDMEKK